MLPSPEEFPYTIRSVSEAISSNGSTSMASISGWKFTGSCEKPMTIWPVGLALAASERPAPASAGRRVRDTQTATDRYANMEVNLLLQEIERYEGVVILTTNLPGARQ